jgi:hypothetical protein
VMENKIVLSDAGFIKDCTDEASLIKEISSIVRGLVLAVKVTVLLALSIFYSAVSLSAVILYMIFFKRLFETIIRKVRKDKPASAYYYKWKKHHLDLKWES